MNTIFTIGHSTHDIQDFVTLLFRHEITAVADVRSTPYSRMNSQFNRVQLERVLKQAGISYVFLGKELGARTDDPACYENGKVKYERLAKTSLFLNGLNRVKHGADGHRVTLLCAEKDPLLCHRTLLIARALHEEGGKVDHILANGDLERHEIAIERLLQEVHLDAPDLFRTHEESIREAYERRAEQVAFVRPTGPAEVEAP